MPPRVKRLGIAGAPTKYANEERLVFSPGVTCFPISARYSNRYNFRESEPRDAVGHECQTLGSLA